MKKIRNRISLLFTHGKFKKVPSYHISEEIIMELAPNQIFVFGSNLNGWHGGGAANFARKNFGALIGTAVGLTGNTYALPTLGHHMEKLPLEKIKFHVAEFIQYAKMFNEKTFLVTEIGCGIAGFKVKDIAPMFEGAIKVKNIHLPEKFWKHLIN